MLTFLSGYYLDFGLVIHKKVITKRGRSYGPKATRPRFQIENGVLFWGKNPNATILIHKATFILK